MNSLLTPEEIDEIDNSLGSEDWRFGELVSIAQDKQTKRKLVELIEPMIIPHIRHQEEDGTVSVCPAQFKYLEWQALKEGMGL